MRANDTISTGKLDWVAVALYAAILFLGWLNIYAAAYDEQTNNSLFVIPERLSALPSQMRQFIFICLSLLLIGMIMIIDMRFFEAVAYVAYGVVLFLLVLMPFIGKEVGGNKNWLGIGSFGIQPSEFAKFATALAVAKLINSPGFRMDNFRNQVVCFALIGVPMVLILAQKDTGTALVFTSFVLVFFREGMSPFLLVVGLCAAAIFVLTLIIPNNWYLYGTIGAVLVLLIAMGKKKIKRIVLLTTGAALLCLVIWSVEFIVTDVLKPHQQNRVKALINPDADPLGYGWNVTQSKIAIGSGGFAGKGFLKGTQTKFDFVPEQSTDFIFCTIGEEHGWLGSLVTIGLFVALLLRVLFLAERQKNRFSRVYGYAVVSILFFHFAVNIGMTIGLFPVIGIPLPFFSHGGSSLWAFTILLFILLKLDAHRSEVLQRI
ncbi:MAG: rod shape-determining protein RodA [Cyclobacteriaceae bacterium]|nr:rod shape-determining protein RodA [Cyclobacteriaceae bacterium]